MAQELSGTRTMALQGGLASPLDNASIFLNPAGSALNPRYDLAAYGDFQQGMPQRNFSVSLMDSKTSRELGAGIAWHRATGNQLPKDDIAIAVSQKYNAGAFGVSGHYRIDREREKRSDMNMDIGFVVDPWKGIFKVAAVSYNLIDPPKGVKNVLRSYALGLGSAWMELFEITADAKYTPGLREGDTLQWSAGVEVTPVPEFAVRGGFGQNPTGQHRRNRVSLGVAAISPGDFDAGYTIRMDLKDRKHPTHAAELSVFLF